MDGSDGRELSPPARVVFPLDHVRQAGVRGSVVGWGVGETLHWSAPSLVDRGVAQRFWGAFERASMSPGMAAALWEMIMLLGVRSVLPGISVSTLVFHHSDSAIPVVRG